MIKIVNYLLTTETINDIPRVRGYGSMDYKNFDFLETLISSAAKESKDALEKVRELFHNDHNAKHILKAIATRKRYTNPMDVYRLKLELQRGGVQLSDQDMFKFFDSLQRFGLGKLRIVKQPNHSTFTWNVTPIELRKIIVSKIPAPTWQPKGIRNTLTNPISVKSESRASGPTMRLFCPLRDETIPMALPLDFNTEDARAIANYLMAVAKQNEQDKFNN